MKPVIISAAVPPDGRLEPSFPGWLVPDTEDLFAVDQRHEADVEAIPPCPASWRATHLPTGMALPVNHYTAAASRDEAVGIAQRFYAQCKARGWDLQSADALTFVTPYQGLSREETLDFWEKVAGWPKKQQEY